MLSDNWFCVPRPQRVRIITFHNYTQVTYHVCPLGKRPIT